ncbi:MAG: cyclic pyranopterin monophosphate synthase MoaC [Lachnospiraceae bacterium]|nr:cyclic pyranopterin monophosphate synthase MoaC [Lachnospiraceae bacterium]
MGEMTHLDAEGNAVMVDVTKKAVTDRIAVASGCIRVSSAVMDAITDGTVPKGDVLAAARIAGIMAAKNTASLIPLCHSLLLTMVSVDFELCREQSLLRSVCTVRLNGRTGAEMEALTGVSVSLLTIYDMCKAMDKTMEITDIRLDEKDGGKTGKFIRMKEGKENEM